MNEIKEKKLQIRREILNIRNSIDESQRILKSKIILNKLYRLSEFKKSKKILFYVSFGSEVNTIDAIKKTLSINKLVILPKVDSKNRNLKLYQIDKIEDISPGYKNIFEPLEIEDKFFRITDIDLIIVPGVAFDPYGNRLGYGGGYYDIVLSRKNVNTKTIALAFEEQLVELLPTEEHDIKVDIIITEKKIIRVK